MSTQLSYAMPDTLPNAWKWSTLGEIADVIAGNPAPQGEEFFAEGNYPFVRVQDMGRLDGAVKLNDTNDHVNTKAAKKLRLFPKGSVLFTKSGASTLLNQRVILGRDMYVVSHIAAAVPKDALLSEWLYYWMRTVDFAYLAHATTLPSLPLSKAKAIPIPIAPLAQQKRIVAEIEKQFSRLDEAVANLKRVKANLKRYKAAVLKAAVEGKLTEEWRKAHPDVEPARELLKRILAERHAKWEQSELVKGRSKKSVSKDGTSKQKYTPPGPPDIDGLRALPQAWEWTSLGQVFGVHVGATPSRSRAEYWNGGIPWVSSGEVAFCKIKSMRETITKLGLENSSTALHPIGTILLGMIGEGKTRGQVAILDIEACNNQNSAAIRVSETQVLPEYVYSFLESEYETTRTRGSGGNQPALNKERVKQIPFPLPPLLEQRVIVSEVDQRLSNINNITAAVDLNHGRLERLRQSLLKKAFSGELIAELGCENGKN